MMKKTILVTGGAGYIGSFMVRRLLAEGHTPIIIDDVSTGNPRSVPDGVKLLKGDFSDPVPLASAMGAGEVDAVMHFAAKTMVGESMSHPDVYYSTNVAKVVGLLDAMVKYGVKSLILSSSAAVYGEPRYLPINEQHPTEAINPYGRSKAMAERIVRDYCAAFGLNAVALRYFNAAGAAMDGACGESQAVKQNLVQIILDNIGRKLQSEIYGNDWNTPDGTCIRDYVHVEDLAEAHLLALEYISDKPEGFFDVFNLGAGKGTSVLEVIKALEKAGDRAIPLRISPRRPGDPEKLVASSEKAAREFGWKPARSDIATIAETAWRWHFNRKY